MGKYPRTCCSRFHQVLD